MKILRELNPKKIIKLYQHNPIFLHFTGHMYGVGCSALDKESCNKINSLKERSDKGFIILIPDLSWLERYELTFNLKFANVTHQFWPGNITMILDDSANNFSHLAKNGTVAVRIPDSPELREFITILDEPIVSTSVNIANEKPKDNLKDIKALGWFDFAFIPDVEEPIDGEASTVINLTKDEIVMHRKGRFELDKFNFALLKPKIIFVCTANICRSPMSDFIAKKLVADEKLPYRIGSAGFLDGGIMISENSYEVLKEHGYEASQHQSTQLNKELVDDCRLILTMTKKHKESLYEMDPNLGDKVFTLSEFTGYKLDIDDPYGLEISFYRSTFDAIDIRVKELFNIISKTTINPDWEEK